MKKIRLVCDTMGAEYLNDYLYFNPKNISHYVHSTNRQALSSKVYPETCYIFINGNSERFTVLAKDFFEVIK